MDRFTKRTKEGRFVVDSSRMEAAIQRLAQFEDAYQELTDSQTQIHPKLKKLRADGKEKTVRYREMMAQKLVNLNMLLFLEKYGIR